MRSRWLALVAAIAVLTVGLGAFANTASAATPGPDLTGSAPGAASVGSNFDFTLTMGIPPVGTAVGGYGIGVIFDSANATTVSTTDLANGCAGWASFFAGGAINDTLGGALPGTLRWSGHGVANTGAAPTAGCVLAKITFNAVAGPAVGIHMVSSAEAAAVGQAGSIDTFTADAITGAGEANTLLCGGVICGPVLDPITGLPLCTPVGCSQAWDVIVLIQNSLPVLAITKAQSASSIVAGGQPETYTISVSQTSGAPATGVTVTDTIPAAFPMANLVGALPAGCTNIGQVITCTGVTLPATLVFTFSASTPTSGNTSPCNTASVSASNTAGFPPAPAPAVVSNSVCVNIIPPAVAWQKSPTSGNLWLCDGSPACDAQSVGEQTNTFTFDEIMINQGDLNGLGGFSFDLHWDITQYDQPVVDLSPAVALFAASGRTLVCTMTILGNGIAHYACASTGPIGVGPVWVGPQVMAHVTLTPNDFLAEQVRPNKENGDISVVKDDQVTVTNTCGQPLNDGTIQPIPGQPECQGVPLLGVGPGGVLNASKSTQTIRRLEGDVTQDCTVDISDMQLEASKYGMSIGGLLYNIFYDVNLPLQHGDGEIDINDIQFVFGRNGSECSAPIPTQPALQAPY